MAGHDRNFFIKVERSGSTYTRELFERKNGQNIPIGNNDEIVFGKGGGKKKTDFHVLKFTIKNGQGCDLAFLQDKQNVMWVQDESKGCPTAPCSMDDTFWTDKVGPNMLHVINMDLKKQTMRFTINMVEKGNPNPGPADYIDLDPVIKNGNGGSSEDFAAARSLIAGAVTGAVVALGTLAMTDMLASERTLLYAIGGAVVGAIVAAVLGRR